MLDGQEVCSYAIIPSLQLNWSKIGSSETVCLLGPFVLNAQIGPY